MNDFRLVEAVDSFGHRVVIVVKTSFLSSDRTYGARRVWHDVLADGVSCGLHRIERLIRIQALRARRPSPTQKATGRHS